MHPQPMVNLLANAPKKFCDNVNGGYSNEVFLVAMFSGQNTTVFTLTPAHMKKFAQWSKHQVESALEQIQKISEIVEPKIKLKVIKDDPDDDKILEAAVEGHADYVVSGDNHLLELKKFRDIKIIRTRAFLDILKK